MGVVVAFCRATTVFAAAQRHYPRLCYDDRIRGAATSAIADLQCAFIGIGLAIVSGMAIGIAMGMFPTLRRILNPYVNTFNAMPTIALVPLVIIWLGLEYEAKVFLTWIVSLSTVIISAGTGVTNVSPAFIETARAFGCNKQQIFRRVILHAAAPYFVAGIRLALGPHLLGSSLPKCLQPSLGLGY